MKGRSGHIEKLGEDWAAAERRGDTGFLTRVLADRAASCSRRSSGSRGTIQGTWLLLGLHLNPIAGPPGGRS
jgi:hypothetical protein